MYNKDTQQNQALIVIDMQNDFIEGGALAVPGSLNIIKSVNNLIENYNNIVFTQDWHPSNHESFNGTWPPHCIQGSFGAEIHCDISTTKAQLILRKGYRQHIDSYSAFFENDYLTPTGLSSYLKEREIKDLVLCGLALDFCVGYSALDAIKCGFNVSIILSASKAIDIDSSLATMLEQLKQHNVELLLG